MIIDYMFYEYEDKYEGGGFTAKGAARVSVERSEAAALDLDHRIPQFQLRAFVILCSYLISVRYSSDYLRSQDSAISTPCSASHFVVILSSYLILDTPVILYLQLILKTFSV